MTADETRCGARREPKNNYDDAAICDLAPGHRGAHYQSAPWQETWTRAPTPPDAGGTAINTNTVEWKVLNDPMWAAVYAMVRQRYDHEVDERVAEEFRLRTEATRPTGEEDTGKLLNEYRDAVEDAATWYDGDSVHPYETVRAYRDAKRAEIDRHLAALRARLDRAEGIEAKRCACGHGPNAHRDGKRACLGGTGFCTCPQYAPRAALSSTTAPRG